jgi:hypothetical protein
MPEYRTTKCSRHGHREFTVTLGEVPVPNLHEFLTSYFEDAVAAGTKFLPGQTLQLGWSTLRFVERSDGTLGVMERELTPEDRWTESVDNALMDMWQQREIVVSVGLQEELTFPRQLEGLMISDCIGEADSFLLTRLPKSGDMPPDFSGWTLRCAQEHDHGERTVVPLLALAVNQPGLVQLLALPHGCTALVMWKEKPDAPAGFKRIVPHVFRGSEELKPKPGSYLAGLQR